MSASLAVSISHLGQEVYDSVIESLDAVLGDVWIYYKVTMKFAL